MVYHWTYGCLQCAYNFLLQVQNLFSLIFFTLPSHILLSGKYHSSIFSLQTSCSYPDEIPKTHYLSSSLFFTVYTYLAIALLITFFSSFSLFSYSICAELKNCDSGVLQFILIDFMHSTFLWGTFSQLQFDWHFPFPPFSLP